VAQDAQRFARNGAEAVSDHFDFSHALSLLKQGKRVAREAWKEWGEMNWVELAKRDDGSPFLVVDRAQGQTTMLSGAHLLADDWHEMTGS
jgi:hypothetical protein